MYPNPTESIATLANLGKGVKKIEVYDEAGRMIKGYNTTNFQQRINLSGYTTGVYTIRLIKGDGIKTFKLIKK